MARTGPQCRTGVSTLSRDVRKEGFHVATSICTRPQSGTWRSGFPTSKASIGLQSFRPFVCFRFAPWKCGSSSHPVVGLARESWQYHLGNRWPLCSHRCRCSKATPKASGARDGSEGELFLFVFFLCASMILHASLKYHFRIYSEYCDIYIRCW